MSRKPILITGASGFMGFHMVRRCRRSGIPCRALVRPTSRTASLDAMGVEVRRGDLLDEDSLASAFDGCRAVVHLAGAADVADPQLNERVNVDGTVNVARACERACVPRLLFFSTNCAIRPLQDAYGRTKLRAEQAIAGFSLDIRTFRPAMMYGEGSREFATFVHTVARAPLVPVPGSGQHILRPVFVDDAIDAAVQAVERDGLDGRTYDIVGPQGITLNQLIQLTASLMGLRRRPLHIPLGLLFWGAKAMGMVWQHPVVTPDQVLGFAQDTTGDLQPVVRDLGWRPRTMDEGMRLLFQRSPWRGLFRQEVGSDAG